MTPSAAREDVEATLGRARVGAAPELAVRPIRQALVGDTDRILILLQVAAGLLLILGLANATGIVLARSLDRRPEIRVRVALAGVGHGSRERRSPKGTLVLGAGAGAITRSLLDVLAHDPGFRSERVVTMRLSLSGDR